MQEGGTRERDKMFISGRAINQETDAKVGARHIFLGWKLPAFLDRKAAKGLGALLPAAVIGRGLSLLHLSVPQQAATAYAAGYAGIT